MSYDDDRQARWEEALGETLFYLKDLKDSQKASDAPEAPRDSEPLEKEITEAERTE